MYTRTSTITNDLLLDAHTLFDEMPHKDTFSWNVMISRFSKLGRLQFARRLFNEMPVKLKDCVVWNSMINGYASNGRFEEAMRLFKDMNVESLDSFVIATVVRACANTGDLDYGKQIHGNIVVRKMDVDVVLLSSLVNMYAKCRDLDSASHVLGAYTTTGVDDFSLSALIIGFAKCGRLADAEKCFDINSRRSTCVVIWNSMIAGYIANDLFGEALRLFKRMNREGIQTDVSTFASVFSACTSLGVSGIGKQVHGHAHKTGVVQDVVVASVLVDMYSKCGSPDDACKFFSTEMEYCDDTIFMNSMISLYCNYGRVHDARIVFETMAPKRSVISWNSMIVGYSQNGCAVEALNLFCEMHRVDSRMMDDVNISSVVSACASICYLRLGEQIFARAITIGLESDQVVSTSLIDLYCKCGYIVEGRRLFNDVMKVSSPDKVTWNSMLMGYSTNGHGTEALKLFEEMRRGGISPNEITFTGVLSACNHCGLVGEGRRWFYSMKQNYHIDPGIEHFSSMIDLFARVDFLEEAMNLIDNMPFKADASIWSSVLRGCVTHGHETLGKKVAEYIIEVDSENSSAYVQLAGMHAAYGDWERASEVRKKIQDGGIRKIRGGSWIEIE
ncbi:hypothetical protein GIB67_031705 [Kingdonia uniflora]|uniref:Pentatricopeptide repeat-containing protein n=1 Tax=Kingdonia uniflora TaxID=39325 RepID=A0A7J7NKL1_9MAGN|nr:hypothetical protein GIB67_031705 [Kingdonia uniflora]